MKLANYSWIDKYLAGSALPLHIKEIHRLKKDGVTDLISLTPSKPLVSKYMDEEIFHHHIPTHSTPGEQQVKKFLDIMTNIREENRKAVVHCQYGQERTGIFLAIYLVEILGFDPEKAIEKILISRPKSLRSPTSIQYLKDRYK